MGGGGVREAWRRTMNRDNETENVQRIQSLVAISMELMIIQKNIYSCFIDYAKDFDCVDHNKVWKILKETGIPDLLMRNLYAG